MVIDRIIVYVLPGVCSWPWVAAEPCNLSVCLWELLAREVTLSQHTNINLHNNLHWNYQQVSKTRRVMLIYARLVEQTTRN